MADELLTPLRSHRVQQRVTARSVALAVGIDPSHYRRIEIAETPPSPTVADKIARHFGNAVTRDQVLYPRDYMTPTAPKKPNRTPLRKAS